MGNDWGTGYGVCQNCRHVGYFYNSFHGYNGHDFYNYAGGDYGLYGGWPTGDQWMVGNGYHLDHGWYVQNQGSSVRPDGNFVSANGNRSPTIMANGYGHDILNEITRKTSVVSLAYPPEVVAGDGDGEPEGNGSPTESIIAVNGTTDEQQQPAEAGEEEVGHDSDLLAEKSKVEADVAPAEEVFDSTKGSKSDPPTTEI